jgi:hypothetical protein
LYRAMRTLRSFSSHRLRRTNGNARRASGASGVEAETAAETGVARSGIARKTARKSVHPRGVLVSLVRRSPVMRPNQSAVRRAQVRKRRWMARRKQKPA